MNSFYLDQNSPRNIYYNLALEESLCLQLNNFELCGGLRFWENCNTIVIGISDPLSKNIPDTELSNLHSHLPSLQSTLPKKNLNHLAIARRASGGGTVFQEKDWNLNYSLFINLKIKKELFPIHDSYQILSNLVLKALKSCGVDAVQAGKSDLSIQGATELLKISGNAQFRKRDCLVHHGTLVLSQKLIDRVKDILKHPPLEPDYRKGRSHEKFISHLPETFSVPSFKKALTCELQSYLSTELIGIPKNYFQKVLSMVPSLMREKYLNSEFIFSRE
jgi:lipoate---protein ligase